MGSPRRSLLGVARTLEPAATGAPVPPSLARGLVRLARPKQWAKNLLVFAAPGAAGVLDNRAYLVDTIVAFVCFCLAASGTYYLNDARDADADRRHPTKRGRPVAAGVVPVGVAYAGGVVLLAAAHRSGGHGQRSTGRDRRRLRRLHDRLLVVAQARRRRRPRDRRRRVRPARHRRRRRHRRARLGLVLHRHVLRLAVHGHGQAGRRGGRGGRGLDPHAPSARRLHAGVLGLPAIRLVGGRARRLLPVGLREGRCHRHLDPLVPAVDPPVRARHPPLRPRPRPGPGLGAGGGRAVGPCAPGDRRRLGGGLRHRGVHGVIGSRTAPVGLGPDVAVRGRGRPPRVGRRARQGHGRPARSRGHPARARPRLRRRRPERRRPRRRRHRRGRRARPRPASPVSCGSPAAPRFDDLLRVIVPLGLFVPVTPGTRFVTVGGAIAADIHGKNHHADGTFSAHVRSLVLALPDGTTRTLTPAGSPEEFWATCGGMGLTGTIVEATFACQRIETQPPRRRHRPRRRPRRPARPAARRAQAHYRYSVAWVDLLARGRHLGRSVLTQGDFAAAPPSTVIAASTTRSTSRRCRPCRHRTRRAVSSTGSRSGCSTSSGSARRPPIAATSSSRSPTFFHPLDLADGWNRLYGRRGFLQWQCLLPFGAEDVLRGLPRGAVGHPGAVVPRRAEGVRRRRSRSAVVPGARVDARPRRAGRVTRPRRPARPARPRRRRRRRSPVPRQGQPDAPRARTRHVSPPRRVASGPRPARPRAPPRQRPRPPPPPPRLVPSSELGVVDGEKRATTTPDSRVETPVAWEAVGIIDRVKRLGSTTEEENQVRLQDKFCLLDATDISSAEVRTRVRICGEVQAIQVVPRAGSPLARGHRRRRHGEGRRRVHRPQAHPGPRTRSRGRPRGCRRLGRRPAPADEPGLHAAGLTRSSTRRSRLSTREELADRLLAVVGDEHEHLVAGRERRVAARHDDVVLAQDGDDRGVAREPERSDLLVVGG